MTLLQFAIGALNDLVDAPVDHIGKPGKPIPAGLVDARRGPGDRRGRRRRRAAARAARRARRSLLIGARRARDRRSGTTSGRRARRSRGSRSPLGIPLLPVFGWYGAAGSLPGVFLVLVPAAANAGTALAIANAIVDMERDDAAGHRVDRPRARARGGRAGWCVGLQGVVAFLALGTAAVVGAPTGLGAGRPADRLRAAGGRDRSGWRRSTGVGDRAGGSSRGRSRRSAPGLLAVAWLRARSSAAACASGRGRSRPSAAVRPRAPRGQRSRRTDVPLTHPCEPVVTLRDRPHLAPRSCPLTDLIRRFRGLGVALVVLAMSAGVVFAAAPARPARRRATGPTPRTPSRATRTPSEAPETEAPETRGAGDRGARDEDAVRGRRTPDKQDAETRTTADTHGALVSAAAQMPTPDGLPQPRRLRLVRRPPEGRDARDDRLDRRSRPRRAPRRSRARARTTPPRSKAAKDAAKAERHAAKAAAQGGAGTPRRPRGRPPRATDPGRSPRHRKPAPRAPASSCLRARRRPSGRCPRSGRRRSRSRAAASRSSGTWRGSPGRSGRSRRGRPGSG